jgi:hypothetical protein
MKTKEAVWDKVEHDMALNLSELAQVSGYTRASLALMKLPLVCGKIPYSDFRRFLRKLQYEALEVSRAALPVTEVAPPTVDPSISARVDELFYGTTNRHKQKRKQ